MRILLLITLFLPLFSLAQLNQTDSNGLRQGLWQKKQDNGRLLYEGQFKDGKPVGEWKRYHSGGQLKAQIEYRGDTAFTQLFDVWKNKLAEGAFVNEQKEGLWKIFNQNRLIADESYTAGVKNGEAHRYYDSGEVMEVAHWQNGEQDGDYQVLFKSGEPYLQCKMKASMRNGLFLVYFENGRQELVAEYQNNLRNGDWNYYTSDGELRYSLHYQQGKILNPQVRDSVDNLQMQELEKNRDVLIDPEKFMEDPSEYMLKNQMNR